MKNILVSGLVGAGLFVGTVVGLLAATDRLNHQGTQGIPLLSQLFQPPAETEEAPGSEAAGSGGETGGSGHGAQQEPMKKASGVEYRRVGDIFDDKEQAGGDGHGDQGPTAKGKEKSFSTGVKSAPDIFADPEKPVGGGYGPQNDPKGGANKGDTEQGSWDRALLEQFNVHPKAGESDAETEHRRIMEHLQRSKIYEYEVGRFFRFPGEVADIDPHTINRYVKMLTEKYKALEEKEKSLELQERELRGLAEDIRTRQMALHDLQTKHEEKEDFFKTAVEEFNRRVLLITVEDEKAYKMVAKRYAGLETEISAGIFEEQWLTEAGQDELLKTMRYMDDDSKDAVLNALGQRNGRIVHEILTRMRQKALIRDEVK